MVQGGDDQTLITNSSDGRKGAGVKWSASKTGRKSGKSTEMSEEAAAGPQGGMEGGNMSIYHWDK